MQMYVLASILKNQIRGLSGDLFTSRSNLGMDGRPEIRLESLEAFRDLLAGLNAKVGNGTLVELGVGRTPDLMIAFALCGAASVTGLDVSRWLRDDPVSRSRYEEMRQILAQGRAPGFVETFGVGVDKLADFETCRNAIRYANYDGWQIPLDGNSVDLIYSKSVLEHVRKAHVAPLLGDQFRVIRRGGHACHIIDLRDHCFIAGDHVEKGDWLDALRYSELVHDLMTNHRPAYINRIRAAGWRRAFETAGFEIVRWETRRRPLSANFDPAALHRDFRHMAEDFAVAWVEVVARKP